jgi:hypothetical protein
MANPDPEGEHLKPPTRRETARTLAVIGWLLVLAAIFMFFFLGVIDDIQATGGSVTTWITGVTEREEMSWGNSCYLVPRTENRVGTENS